MRNGHDDYVENLKYRLVAARKLVAENLNKQRLKMKENYDKRAKKIETHCEGDQVLLHEPVLACGKNRKIQPHYSGPFYIKKVLSPVTYTIMNREGDIKKNVHHNRLKKSEANYVNREDKNKERFEAVEKSNVVYFNPLMKKKTTNPSTAAGVSNRPERIRKRPQFYHDNF